MVKITGLKSIDIQHVASLIKSQSHIDPSFFDQINDYLKRKRTDVIFRVSLDGSVYIVAGTEQLKISNTFVLPIGDKITHYLDKVERHLEVACLLNGVWHHPIYLTPNQLRADKDWLRKELGFKSLIFSEYSLITEYINILCTIAPTIHDYAYIGWSKSHPHLYITGSGAIGDHQGLNIVPNPSIAQYLFPEPKISKYDAIDAVMNTFFRIATPDFIYPALSYMFLSCYTSLLSDFPQTPEFVLYVYGKTGSRKTSVSKLIFSPFNDWERIPLNFTATTPAIELVRLERRDTVTLIDDIPPTVSPQEQNTILSKLEAIFRSTGDSIGRKKMISRNKSQEMKGQGLIAVTAEDLYVKSASSIARGFFIKVTPSTVNLKKLTKAQSMHEHYSAAIYYFIDAISKDVEKFKTRIRKLFKKYERYFAGHHEVHGRQTASAAWIHASLHIFLEFALATGAINDETFEEILDQNQQIMHDKITEMARFSRSHDEVELFIRAVKELIASKSLMLYDIKFDGRKKCADIAGNHSKVLGYRDSQYLYLLSDSVFAQVCSHYSKQSLTFPVTQETLWSSLRNKSLLVPDRNKDGTRTVRITINGDRISVIRIDRTLYEHWGENPYDYNPNELPGSLARSLQYA